MTIRVVVAEDYDVMREGLRHKIESASDLELVGICEDFESLIKTLDRELPDVLLTDIRMPPTGTEEGIRASEHLRRIHPKAGVVLLSNHDDPAYVYEFFKEGTSGRAYLLKERWGHADHVLSAIREVAAGRSSVDPKVVEVLVEARSWEKNSPLRFLSRRENDVLREMAYGRNNAGIAQALCISLRAVEGHINAIFSKLSLAEEVDIDRRVKAVLLFLSSPQRRPDPAHE